MIDTRLSRITSRDLDHRSVYIVSLDINFDIIVNQFIRFIYRLIPELLRDQVRPFFCRKGTIHPRCDIRCDHCCFYRKCTTSAERIHQNSVLVPWSQHDQCCCQCLCDRCFSRYFTISSFMQRYTGCIDSNRHNILFQEDTDRICCSVFRKPFYLVLLLHSSYHCLFHH